jgi:hypothetical protein
MRAYFLRLWRARRRSFRFLCFRIFLRRFLMTLPTGSPFAVAPPDGESDARSRTCGAAWVLARRSEVNSAARADRPRDARLDLESQAISAANRIVARSSAAHDLDFFVLVP